MGGSSNRHILVLPPSPKSLSPQNEKPPTAEKLPPYDITYRHILVLPHSPKLLPPKNETPSTAEKLPPYRITYSRHILVLPPPPKSLPLRNKKPTTVEKLPPYFGFIASAEVVTTKKQKTAYHRMSLPPQKYRHL